MWPSFLSVVAKIGGKVKGVLYFEGKPAYDTLSGDLQIVDFNFDVDTYNVLAKSAEWLLHDEFKEKISKELHWPLREYSQKSSELIQNGISQSKLSKKLSVSIHKFQMEPQQFLITNENLQLLVNAKGEIELKLKVENLQ